jgi:hypothetical protein
MVCRTESGVCVLKLLMPALLTRMSTSLSSARIFWARFLIEVDEVMSRDGYWISTLLPLVDRLRSVPAREQA